MGTTHLQRISVSQRAYIAIVVAMMDGRMKLDQGPASTVARYLRAHRPPEGVLCLVGESFNDPLPLHCFLTHVDGRRLADANRVCRIRGRFYDWKDKTGKAMSGVITTRIHVHVLYGGPMISAAALRQRRATDLRT